MSGVPRGATLTPGVLWELGKRWYDDRLQLDWERRSIPDRQQILTDVGLTGPFWDLRGPG